MSNAEKSRRSTPVLLRDGSMEKGGDGLAPAQQGKTVRAPKLGELKKKEAEKGEIFMSTDVDEDNSFTFGNASPVNRKTTPVTKRAPRLGDLPKTPSIVKGDKLVLMSIEIDEEQSFDFGEESSIEGEANDETAVAVDNLSF